MKHARTFTGVFLSAAACSSPGAHDAPDAATSIDAFAIGLEPIPLATPDGSYYDVTVTVGAETFAMDLDSGSTTVGVAAKSCTSCGVTPLYSPAPAAVDMHHGAMTEYADGSGWSGEIFSDVLGLGYETPPVPLDFVAISSQEGGFFDGADYQGIMGLGPRQLLEPGTSAYVPAATAAGATPIIAFELCPSHGRMWFGGFDPSAGQGDVQYTTMPAIDDDNPFYSINVDDMKVGGTSLGFTAADFQEPVIDTGTSFAYLPTKVHDGMVAAINNDPAFQSLFPGQTISDDRCVRVAGVTATEVDAALPALSLDLPSASGTDITISVPPTSSYLIDGGNGQFCLAINDGGTEDGATFGDTFIRGYLTIIDVAGGRIGFAPDAGCAASGDAHRVIDRTTIKPHRPHPHPRTRAALQRARNAR